MSEYFRGDTHIGRQVIRRAEITAVYDDGDLQLVDAMGYNGERFRRLHRMQYFGSSENPPLGAHAVLAMVNGRPEQAIMLGAEVPDKRPRNTGDGEKVLYNAHGDVIGIYKQKVRIVTQVVEIEAPSIKLKGAMTLDGDITHTGNMTTSGVHVDSNGPHA